MAVLPPKSKLLVPEPLRVLMTNPTSEIIDFYPNDFKLDMNGKKNDWEAVILLSFLEEKRLLKAIQPDSARNELKLESEYK
eukprot:Pgem_evm1s5481